MKLNPKMQKWIPSALLGLLLAASTSTVLAATDYTICTFDTDICVFNTANGNPPALYYWTNDVGNPAGSAYLVINWANNTSGWQDSKSSWDLAWPGADCPNYANVEFDVKIDQANSYPAADGTYGGVQVVCQGWNGWGLNTEAHNWVGIGGAGLRATNGWQHVVMSLAGFPWTLSRLCLNFYGNPPSATTNTICYFVDNLKLVTPPAPPPTMAIQMKPKPQPALNLFASQAGGQYQRQSIRALDTTLTWYNQSAPTTYSFAITNFPAGGTTNYTDSFDTGISPWGLWWGGGDINSGNVTFSWDSTTPDAGGRCANDSLKVSVPFTGAANEQASIRGLFPAAVNGTKYNGVAFDIKVDPSSGPVTSGGNYGTFDAIGFAWNQVQVGSYTIPLTATNWTHVVLPFSPSLANLNGIQGFWFKMWSGTAHTNTLTFWLDNVQLQAVAQNFQAHMYLVPGPYSGTGSSPDWNETNCIFLQIQMAANGNAAGVFRYKTNFPNSNGGTNVVSVTTNENCVAVTNVANYFSACQLANITNGPVLGTWSLTFDNNTNVLLSGPGGSTNFTIPPEVLSAMFANSDGTMLVYYGVDPNGTNTIGQKAVFTRAVVTNMNFGVPIDDRFSGDSLDTLTWAISASDPGGVFVVPMGSKGWLTWTLPDAGFSLQASSDLMDRNSWAAPAFYTFINNNVRQALMGPVYDTEMTQLDVSGGSMPAGLMIRESPTKASLGQTTVQPVAGGTYKIMSAMEVYTEVSTDNGLNWYPATNGPAPLTMSGTYPTNTLPPVTGRYATSAPWTGLYANGVVISNVVVSSFSDSFPLPPDLTDPVYSYGAAVDVDVSTDGGVTFTTYALTPANVTTAISTGAVNQRFFRLMKPGS